MSIFDHLKRVLAPFVHPVAVVDSTPGVLEEGDVRPLRMGPSGGLSTEQAAGSVSNVAIVDPELALQAQLPASLGPQSYASSLSITQAVPPPTFTAIAQTVPIADDKSMISIALDGAATGAIVIREIVLINQQTSPIPGQIVNFELLRFATHSAGTLLTAVPHAPDDTLSSLVTIRSEATIASPGALLRRWPIACDEWGSGALDTESFQTLLGNLFPLWSAARDFAAKPYTILPGGGVHIKVATPIAPNTNITVLDAIIVFTSTVAP